MEKKIYILSAVGILFLFVVIIVLLILSNSAKKNKNPSFVVISPAPGSFFNGTNPNTPNRQTENTQSQTETALITHYGSANLQLSKSALTSQPSIKTDVFEMKYNPQTRIVEVILKGDKAIAEKAFVDYMQAHNYTGSDTVNIQYNIIPPQNQTNSNIPSSSEVLNGRTPTIPPVVINSNDSQSAISGLFGISEQQKQAVQNRQQVPNSTTQTSSTFSGSPIPTSQVGTSANLSQPQSPQTNGTPAAQTTSEGDTKQLVGHLIDIFNALRNGGKYTGGQFKLLVPQQAIISSPSNTGQTNLTPPPNVDISNSSILTCVVDAAQRITQNLKFGSVWSGYYNKNVSQLTINGYTSQYRAGLDTSTSASGIYWCTNLVIDSYNMCGYHGLGPQHQSVISLANYWQGAGNPLVYFDYSSSDHLQTLSKIKPGCAVFFESQKGIHTGHEHTAIVKNVSLNTHGDGVLETYDANSTDIVTHYPVASGNVRNVPYPIVAFGCAQ